MILRKGIILSGVDFGWKFLILSKIIEGILIIERFGN